MNATDEKIRTMLRDLESAAPPAPRFEQLQDATRPDNYELDPPGRTGRLVVMVAAGSLVVAGLGSLLLVADRQDREQPVAAPLPTEPPAPPVALVVDLPDELRLPHPGGIAVRDEASSYQRRVFGAVDDPGDPSQMVHLEYSSADGSPIPCHVMPSNVRPGGGAPDVGDRPTVDEWIASTTPVVGALPFEVGGTTGQTCQEYGVLSAGWYADGLAIGIQAGAGVDRDQLVALAQSMTGVAPATTGQGVPPADLVADPLPAGWITLVDEDVPYAQRITETGWTATVGGIDGSPSQLLVHAWTGVDEQGVYAKMPPIQAERITVRGHDGYRYVSEQRGDRGPLQLEVWWTEQPGMVVYVWSTNLYEPDELMDLIDQMVPVNEAGYAEFQAVSALD